MSEEQFQAYLKMMQKGGFSSTPSAADIQRAKQTTLASRTDKGGFFNLGNTCWLNSLFQIFKHSKTYLPLIREKANSQIEDATKLLAKAICDVIDLSEQEVSEEVNTQLYDNLVLFLELLSGQRPDLTNGRQHDPNEALLFLVDYLHLDEGLPKITKRSFFKAVHADLHHHKENPDASEQITLSNIRMHSIQKGLLQEYMAPQTLDEDNKILFEGSDERKLAYKLDYFTIDSAPQELVIQAPRFWNGPTRRLASGEMHSDRFKNTTRIIFEPQVQIPLYSTDGSRVERILTLEIDTVSGHTGTLTGGHYVAYHRNDDGTFTCYNDSHVRTISFKQAMREIQEKGYLATYRVVDDKPLRGELQADVKTLEQVVPLTIPLHPPAQEDRSETARRTPPLTTVTPRPQPSTSVASKPPGNSQTSSSSKPVAHKTSDEPIEDGWDLLNDFSQQELDEALRAQQQASATKKLGSKPKARTVSLPPKRSASPTSLSQGGPLPSPKNKKSRKDLERLLALYTPAQDNPNHLRSRNFSRISSANDRFVF